MSTMSTTTTSMACDHTLGNDPDLLKHMCVLVIAWGDGTQFDANSIQEEYIVEFCVEVGQAHPKGGLQLLAT